ncbi:GTP-binding protein [Bacillus sp. V3B]|uniref:CobW family GTP-binding protein n=1 Tax=Bacillus sp. V3B TaxID=2804915 RepID=UPI002108D720|nr:GTP-binding protein [Bacillus sp. V3B]MCQ6276003.1 GTP-binding protein [Bacillus sp. V3B]
MKKNVDIYILGGFLGSGKTTLLKNLLMEEKERNRKVAVLMNELGEYSVDTGIIGTDVTLTELLDGCICCTMKDEVELQLLKLYQEEQPDVIYIETTGVAHPIEILDACLSPVIGPYVQVKSIISIVDAKRWLDRTQLSDQLQKLLEEQVRYGDNILLNKTDCVSFEELETIQTELKEINSRAQLSLTTFGDVPLSKFRTSREKNDDLNREELHVHYHLHIRTMTYSFQEDIDRSDFEYWLKALSPNIFRVKGFVRFKDDPRTHLVQYAYGVPYIFAQPMEFPTNLILIGNNLDKEQVKKDLLALEN